MVLYPVTPLALAATLCLCGGFWLQAPCGISGALPIVDGATAWTEEEETPPVDGSTSGWEEAPPQDAGH